MSEVAALITRIEALEIRLAHQEQVIEDLNRVTTDQWAQIDTLKRQIDQLGDRVQDVESNRPSLPEPPPPHY
jgi:SlyX protein